MEITPRATLQVYVTSGDTLSKKGGRYSGKFSWPANPQSITVKSSLGGSATAVATTK